MNGTEGALRVVYAAPEPLARWVGADRDWEPVDPSALPGVPAGIVGDATGHAAFFRAAFEALDRGRPLPVTGAQARHNLAIVEAARVASESRRAVEVPA